MKKTILFFILYFFLFPLAIFAQPGTLDPTFGNGGKTSTSIMTYNYGESVAIQSDGKILVAGSANTGVSPAFFAVIRYNADGTLDNTFDGDGKVTTVIGASCMAYAIVIQGDGKIILAGKSYNGSNWDFALVRYNIDGTLDNTFDLDGIVITDILGPNFIDEIRSLGIQSDGKIVAVGSSDSEIGIIRRIHVVRYNVDGSLDNSFDADGIVTTNILNYDLANRYRRLGNNKILLLLNGKAKYICWRELNKI